jgi:hypothetical protein
MRGFEFACPIRGRGFIQRKLDRDASYSLPALELSSPGGYDTVAHIPLRWKPGTPF